jgi:hypothetical protein
MVARGSSETLLSLCPNTASCIPKGCNLHIPHTRNVISYIIIRCLEMWFSAWFICPSRGPHEISKEPQESDGKVGATADFDWLPQLLCLNKIFNI